MLLNLILYKYVCEFIFNLNIGVNLGYGYELYGISWRNWWEIE